MFAANSQSSMDNKAVPDPYSFWRMLPRMNTIQVSYTTVTYDTANTLTLDFYAPLTTGKKSCVIVVNGGSWAASNMQYFVSFNSLQSILNKVLIFVFIDMLS